MNQPLIEMEINDTTQEISCAFQLEENTLQDSVYTAPLPSFYQTENKDTPEDKIIWLDNQHWALKILIQKPKLFQTDYINEPTLDHTIQHSSPLFLPAQLLKILALVHHKYGNITVKDISDRYGLSQRRIQQIFKKWIGLSPKRYCQIIRMNTAGKMLLESDASLSAIIDYCGFYDQAHFNREFKKFWSLNPKAFRNQLKTIIENRDKITFSFFYN